MTALPSIPRGSLRDAINAAAGAPRPAPSARGLDAWWHALGRPVSRVRHRPARYLHAARAVDAARVELASVSDTDLRARAGELRERFARGRCTRADEHAGLAVACEVASRLLSQRPFLVQIAGALAIADGCIAEMATGEGKTLTAALAATLAGWRGRGCHVVTVNDYLAERDAAWMRPVFEFCGLTSGVVIGATEPDARRAAYARDITYSTNKEVAADFLRDRLLLGDAASAPGAFGRALHTGAVHAARPVLRTLECAIVDEADSVLIDEAVTPLIIAAPAQTDADHEVYRLAAELAASLRPEAHFRVNRAHREVNLTPAGRAVAETLAASFAGRAPGPRRREELLVQALVARELHTLGTHYILDQGKIVIVDEFTGRLMPDRTWRDGLHQAVEAKEGLTINAPTQTLARISFQRFFRLYRRLSGMTGTAREARAELWRTYSLPVVPIPTNRPVRRERLRTRMCVRAEDKWSRCARLIAEAHARGQPVLVGCRTVRESEALSARLDAAGIAHRVLNAQRAADEARVVEHAGTLGAVTIATNMAGRGTDIRLAPGAAERGGLLVIATARHDTPRIDRQLEGRAARQGDPGQAQAVLALDDDLYRASIGVPARMLGRVLARVTPAGTVPTPLAWTLTRMAQVIATRRARAQRAAVLAADDWLEESLGFAGRAP